MKSKISQKSPLFSSTESGVDLLLHRILKDYGLYGLTIDIMLYMYNVGHKKRATLFWAITSVFLDGFLQRVSIACYICRALIIDSVRPTVRPSVTRWYHAKTTPATIMRSLLEDSPMTVAS